MSFSCERLRIRNGNEVLVDVRFSFHNSFALIGESGSGKSLTLKALLGMLPHNLDVEFVDAQDISDQKQIDDSVAADPKNLFGNETTSK